MTWKTTTCAFVFESSEDPSRLILLVAWNSDWHSFAFHFSFFYTQFFGFGFRRRLGMWYTRPISVITRSLRFPYILFSFLHWPDFESEIQTQRGAQYPVNVPWYTKRKKKAKKDWLYFSLYQFLSLLSTLTTIMRMRIAPLTLDDYPTFSNSTWCMNIYLLALTCFDVTWWDMKMGTTWLIYMNEVRSDVAT